jgi:hypothetical protein
MSVSSEHDGNYHVQTRVFGELQPSVLRRSIPTGGITFPCIAHASDVVQLY